MGYIWENMPPVEVVNKLAPKGEMQNLKGKRSVLAYRDNQDDPFHYVFFSYDARGRVESIIRWTENIGFEIVKYGYNSMNKVQFVNVIDAARQYSTWNVYDDNGKLWKVYSKMGDAGSGYDYQNQNYENIRLPVPMSRPLSPDITYSYTKRNEVENISYNSAYANKQIFYDPMGWVDSLIVERSGEQIFRQILDRDDMGMVIQQKSKHPTQPNQDEKTINYTYDNLNRLTEWKNPVNNIGQTFTYDDIGNRTGSTDNGLDLEYYYNTNKNQLSEVNKYADTTFNFVYNSYGAVTSVIKKYQANIIKQETWEYVNSTVPKIYSKQVGSDVWTWRYRRGAFDTREQKRLVVSPFGDGGNEGEPYAQSWEYSLTGVVGEELVLYKGIQTTKTALVWPLNNGQTDQGRRVYMAMSRFFVVGTELQYLANGYKELHITDNQGNVRTIFQLGYNSDIRSFDYKPFGEKEWTSNDNDRDRKGFAGSEYDSESDYYAMGYRMYSAEFGRFLAVDPLFETMPRHNPYHYSFNSPMFWSDPSGLVPVKEKVKNSEKLLMLQLDTRIFEEAYDGIVEENGRAYARMSRTYSYDLNNLRTNGNFFSNFFSVFSYVYNLDMLLGGGGSGATARSGEEAAGENGDCDSQAGKGLSYRTRLNKGESWENLTDERKAELMSEANQKLGELTQESGKEWSYAIVQGVDSEGFTYVEARNFETLCKSAEVYVDYYIGLTSKEKIVGSGHSHTNGSNEFSVGDFQGLIRKIGDSDVIQNGFTSFNVAGFSGKYKTSMMTVFKDKLFLDNTSSKWTWVKGEALHNTIRPAMFNNNYKSWGFRVSNIFDVRVKTNNRGRR